MEITKPNTNFDFVCFSKTAVLVIIALYFLGGEMIHGFAFALLVGFVIGTYSSIYVASPIVLWFERGGQRA